jgi:hypothetical protein
MQIRNHATAVLIGVVAAVATSFADVPLGSQQPADIPAAAAPAAPAPPENSDAAKKRKAHAIAVREAVKARMARCRLHPETCKQ